MDYEKEASITSSEEFHSELVSKIDLLHVLRDNTIASSTLDTIKKALFYGESSPFANYGNGKLHIPISEDTNKNILHGIIGIVTEAGELIESLRFAMIKDKEIDAVNVKEEIGNIFWYCALLANELGVSFEDIQKANIEKLRSRYPNKFTEYDAKMA